MKTITKKKTVGVVALVALVLVSLLCLSGCGGGSAPQADTSQAKGSSEDTNFMHEGKNEKLVCGVTGKLIKIAPAILAENLGYFEEENCNVEIQQIALNDAMTALTNNQLDIDLFGVVPTSTYVAQGAQSYIFGGTILNGSEICVLNSFDKSLATAEDFKGFTIGCQRAETGQMVFKDYLQQNGLVLGQDVTFIYVEGDQPGFEGIKKGELDMYITNNAQGFVQQKNDIKVAATVKQFTGDYPCCRQNCSEEAYHTKYLSLVDFEIALLRGYKTYVQEPETVIPILVEYSGQDEDYVRAAMYGTDEYENVMDLSPDPNKKAVVEFYQTLKNIGEIDANTPHDINDYVITSIYKQALDTMAEREPDEQLWKDLQADYQKKDA